MQKQRLRPVHISHVFDERAPLCRRTSLDWKLVARHKWEKACKVETLTQLGAWPFPEYIFLFLVENRVPISVAPDARRAGLVQRQLHENEAICLNSLWSPFVAALSFAIIGCDMSKVLDPLCFTLISIAGWMNQR